MCADFRLTVGDLFDVLADWDSRLDRKVFLAACGGLKEMMEKWKP
jgi:hypothetical protein